jgi:hypothetical protein
MGLSRSGCAPCPRSGDQPPIAGVDDELTAHLVPRGRSRAGGVTPGPTWVRAHTTRNGVTRPGHWRRRSLSQHHEPGIPASVMVREQILQIPGSGPVIVCTHGLCCDVDVHSLRIEVALQARPPDHDLYLLGLATELEDHTPHLSVEVVRAGGLFLEPDGTPRRINFSDATYFEDDTERFAAALLAPLLWSPAARRWALGISATPRWLVPLLTRSTLSPRRSSRRP